MIYYNEIDPRSAAAIKALIYAGELPRGFVDQRSIEDVCPDELSRYSQCHFFAGIGLWAYSLAIAGWPEDQPVWTASCPCQPFSAAGAGGGLDDERHLWPDFHWLAGKRRPPIILGEQVKNGSWIDLAHADMEGLGYAFGCVPLPVAGFGGSHIRDRAYWVAHTERDEQPREEPCRGQAGRVGGQRQSLAWPIHWQVALTELRSLDDGHPRCVGATDAIRNAIAPPVAKAFIQAAMAALLSKPDQ